MRYGRDRGRRLAPPSAAPAAQLSFWSELLSCCRRPLDVVGGERHQEAAPLAHDDHGSDGVIRAVGRLDGAEVMADPELVDRLAQRAGDDVPREVSLDGGNVDRLGRIFRHTLRP